MAHATNRVKAKRTKAYRPSWNSGGVLLKAQPWKVRSVFGPLEAIIDQLEQDGTVNTSTNGTPIFQDQNDGHWYCSVSALNGVIEAYEIHERRQNRSLELEPLRRLSNKLQYSAMIFESDTHDARACLRRMRMETMQMTANYAKGLVRDFKIMESIEQLQAAA